MFGIPSSSAYSFGRHTLTFAMGVVAALAATHIFTGSQATSATEAVNQISTGVASIITGASTLAGLAGALYGAFKASPLNQLISVSHNPEVKAVVVTTPALADSVPSSKVVSQ